MASNKRRVNRVKVHQKQDDIGKPKKTEAIKMAPNTKKRRKANLQENKPIKKTAKSGISLKRKRKLDIVEGGVTANKKQRRRSAIFTAAAFVVIAAVVIISVASPTGFIEWSQNLVCTWGSGGGLPVAINGDVALNLDARGGTSFVLTDNHLYAYNSTGKEIAAFQHGYLSPTLDVSSQRTLVYDRGNYCLRVDALYKNIAQTEFKNTIITADIADCGYTAVALNDEQYAATVTVYDRHFLSIFKWSSSAETVTNVRLSPNGKTLCVVTVKSNQGTFESTINFFNVKTGEKTATKTVAGTMFVDSVCNSRRIFFTSPSSAVSMKWDATDFIDYGFSNITYVGVHEADSMFVAYNSDASNECTVSVLKKDGSQKASLSVPFGFNKICVGKKYVYTLEGDKVTQYNYEGKQLKSFTVGQRSTYIAPYKNGVLTTADMKLGYYS